MADSTDIQSKREHGEGWKTGSQSVKNPVGEEKAILLRLSQDRTMADNTSSDWRMPYRELQAETDPEKLAGDGHAVGSRHL